MRAARALLFLLAAAAPALAAPGPGPGRYDGRFCVTVASAAPDCGTAVVDVLRERRLRVRIADIVYHLQLHSSQLDVVLMHGAMQIDGFVAPYEWAGQALQFDDLEKRTRYELTLKH
ncbi:MAG: hypothetical protein KF788_00980 [Piscinibacter sp.]|nr:hypothetical protein [Piscinibacter sp.]